MLLAILIIIITDIWLVFFFVDDSFSSVTETDMDETSSMYSDATAGISDYTDYTTASGGTTTSYRSGGTTTLYSPSDVDLEVSSVSFSDLASLSLSDVESDSPTQVEKLCLHIHCDGRQEEEVRHLYQPLFDWIDPSGDIFAVINERNLPPGFTFSDSPPLKQDSDHGNKPNGLHLTAAKRQMGLPVVQIPSLAVVLFLKEDTMVGSERLDMANTIFEKLPWTFHHSESVTRGKINPYPYNNQNYYTAGPNDPLCAIRQIHCGTQHVRLVRFTSADTWQDQINLYGLLLGQEPEVRKPDFCLFTAASHGDYDIQLALKKVPKDIECRCASAGALGFRVGQVGHLVPLLPHMCSPISDTRWRTTDLDGNAIYLDVFKPSRDSDSGVSTSFPIHSTPYTKTQREYRKQYRNQYKKRRARDPDSLRARNTGSPLIIASGNESDASSVITDLDSFMKSVLQPLIEHRRSKTPSLASSEEDNLVVRDESSAQRQERQKNSAVPRAPVPVQNNIESKLTVHSKEHRNVAPKETVPTQQVLPEGHVKIVSALKAPVDQWGSSSSQLPTHWRPPNPQEPVTRPLPTQKPTHGPLVSLGQPAHRPSAFQKPVPKGPTVEGRNPSPAYRPPPPYIHPPAVFPGYKPRDPLQQGPLHLHHPPSRLPPPPLSPSDDTSCTHSEGGSTLSKTSVKSVRFNQVIDYASDVPYSYTDTEDELATHNEAESQSEGESSHEPFKAPPVVKNGYQLYYNDTDEESYFSEAGIDVDFQASLRSRSVPKLNVSQKADTALQSVDNPKALVGFYI